MATAERVREFSLDAADIIPIVGTEHARLSDTVNASRHRRHEYTATGAVVTVLRFAVARRRCLLLCCRLLHYHALRGHRLHVSPPVATPRHALPPSPFTRPT